MAVGCPSNGCRASSSVSDILASAAQKMIRTKSPINNNAITLNNVNYFENNHTINQESTYKDLFYTMKNNTDKNKENDNKKSKKNLINNIKNKKILKIFIEKFHTRKRINYFR